MSKKYGCVGHPGMSRADALSFCEECLRKQLQIDRLKEENQQLKAQLRYHKKRLGGQFSEIFGLSTPSSKLSIKENTEATNAQKKGGAPKGKKVPPRALFQAEQADEVIALRVTETSCPDCGGKLESTGVEDRCVVDALLTEAKRLLYRCQEKQCRCCRKKMNQTPLTLPRFKYGNSLITNAVIAHYLEGVPVRQIARTLGAGVSAGGLLRQFHYLAKKWAPVLAHLKTEYQESEVRHADETGWRTDGKNGYAWLFCTERLSIFQFGKTRAGSVPLAILGDKVLSGVLIVDRYGGYNRMPCQLQYCYAHLLRDLQGLEKKFPKSKEVKIFVSALAPFFAEAMSLRRKLTDDSAYTLRAKKIQEEMLSLCEKQAKASAIQTFQRLILDNQHRLFHWVSNRNIPPDNNRAERELRPTVIARKNSFGSQSQKGAETRSILMSVLHTAAKRIDKATTMRRWFLSALDALARDPKLDLLQFLIDLDSPP